MLCLTKQNQVLGRSDFELPWRRCSIARCTQENERRALSSAKVQTFVVETELPHNGRKSWIEGTITPVCDRWGKVTMLFGLLEDVTAHRRAHKVLRECNTHFRLMLNQMPGDRVDGGPRT